MRIDAHQHFWIYEPREYDWIDDRLASLRRDFLPADLKPELARFGFEGSIAVQARQSLEDTRWLLELADRAPFIVGVVGWVDLCSTHVRRDLERFAKHPKFRGVRHVVQSEPDDRFLLRPDFQRGVSALAEFELTYDILIYPRHLQAAIEFARQYPRQRFVLDHLAKPLIASGEIAAWEQDIRELARNENVVCKVSGLVTEADWKNWEPEQFRPYLDVVFEAFGPRRLMIGSDWPVCTVAATYERAVDVVMDYLQQFSEGDREAVLGGTAVRFWRLNG